MIGTPRETLQPRAAFVKSYDRPSTLWLRIPRLGRVTAARARRYVFPRYPFSLSTSFAAMTFEVVAVAHGRRRPATGDRDSDAPSNSEYSGRRCAPPLIRTLAVMWRIGQMDDRWTNRSASLLAYPGHIPCRSRRSHQCRSVNFI